MQTGRYFPMRYIAARFTTAIAEALNIRHIKKKSGPCEKHKHETRKMKKYQNSRDSSALIQLLKTASADVHCHRDHCDVCLIPSWPALSFDGQWLVRL
jgi:hypothetical protein